MSSETSTDERADSLQPWQLFTLAGLIGATIVVFMSRGQTPGGIILLSLIIFAAASVGLAALRTFLPLVSSAVEGASEILGGRTRAALEREKTLVLRSIKELEFDRSMRKVSEKDFAEMSARLRARAARLMRQLDAGSVYREQIEREIEQRLASREGGRGVAGRDVAAPPVSVQAAPVEPVRAVEHLCPSCESTNDPDARFCKSCGARMETA